MKDIKHCHYCGKKLIKDNISCYSSIDGKPIYNYKCIKYDEKEKEIGKEIEKAEREKKDKELNVANSLALFFLGRNKPSNDYFYTPRRNKHDYYIYINRIRTHLLARR